MAGDRETGMMIMKMDAGLDTGPVAMAERIAIAPDMTAGELHDRLMAIGADLMVKAMSGLERGELTLRPQAAEGVTYARKIDKAETRIDWTLANLQVHNHIRGLSPFPGAWCEIEIAGKVERLKLLRSTLADGQGEPGEILDERLAVACGEGAVRLLELQRAGGKPVTAEQFLRGAKIRKGMKLA
jgi:methionyl-tRNA formyltransferase